MKGNVCIKKFVLLKMYFFFFLDAFFQKKITRFCLFELTPTLSSHLSFGYCTNRDFLLARSQKKLPRFCSHNPENPAVLEAELRGTLKP